ncbi:hypothetical protein [Nonomuraea candida]|uniref:hypothetical protein n=1 Tax=Nonomuraea candida TaxID=359159 RepID=UPI000693E7FA|nr:hypothetical protein [Nonomuraea candida]
MTEISAQPSAQSPEHGDFDVSPFRRLRYFHGQMLTARDFQREQEYFREKLMLRMRSLLGYGVVCGLYVEPVPADGPHDDGPHETNAENAGSAGSAGSAGASGTSETGGGDAAETSEAGGSGEGHPEWRRRAKVRLTSGLGVDCDGHELVVPGGCVIDLWEALHEDERSAGTTVWIGIEYDERAVEPTRTVFNSSCADTSDCEYGYTEESYAVRVTTRRPPDDERCEPCCSRCEHKVLWLARIDDVDWRRPVRGEQIRMNIRRLFGKRVPTVITGINWRHGHTYTVDEARELLGTQKQSGGLVVRFSDDVRVDSLQPGVVEIQVIEGGAGRNADTWYMGGKFEEPAGGEYTRHFRYRQTTRETLQDGDRVLVTVRAAFILDRCCRPVDGTNVGGKVPYLRRGRDIQGDWPEPAENELESRRGCGLPPSGIGPWTSGTGAGGDVFESWFFVTEERR